MSECAEKAVAKFPSEIRISDEQSFPIRQIADLPALGYMDRESGEIAIKENQPEIGKHIILIHEIVHHIAEQLIHAGAIKRQPDEAFITGAAPMLLNMLLGSGLYRCDFSQADLHKFMDEILKTA